MVHTRQTALTMTCALALLAGTASAQRVALPVMPNALPEVVAPAPVNSEIPADLEQTFGQLSSPDFQSRQQATEALLADDRLTLAMVEKVLRRPELSEEARTRLLQVGRQIFFRTPRAAMGLQFGGNLRDRVVVDKTFEKFESFRLLEQGDLIVEAGGYRLDGPGSRIMVQSIIISRDPGESLPVVIRRGAQRLELSIPLGRFADLENNANFIPEDRLARAWRMRSAQFRGDRSAAIRVAPPAGGWSPTLEQQRRVELAALRRQAMEGAPQIAGGGMARGAEQLPDEQRFVQQVVVMNGRQQVINMPIGRQFGEVEFEATLPPMSPAEELLTLAQAKAKITAELKSLPDPAKLTPNDDTHNRIAERRHALEVVEKQRLAIEAEVADGNSGKQSAAESADPK